MDAHTYGVTCMLVAASVEEAKLAFTLTMNSESKHLGRDLGILAVDRCNYLNGTVVSEQRKMNILKYR